VRRLLVTESVVPITSIIATLMKVALSSFETPVLTRAMRRNIPEDAILLPNVSHVVYALTPKNPSPIILYSLKQ
jgi:hypothetical protein